MLTAERLRQLLNYDPATGIFTWRVRSNGRVPAGTVAGGMSNKGYRQISVDGDSYKAHRLAWLYVYGEWPQGQLDHKDTIKDHNWISNLRPATGTQNNANSRRRKDNTSGLKGATYYPQRRKWVAQITVERRRHYLGIFETAEAAHAAYAAAAIQHFAEFARAA